MKLLKTEFHGISVGNIHSTVQLKQDNGIFMIMSSGKENTWEFTIRQYSVSQDFLT